MTSAKCLEVTGGLQARWGGGADARASCGRLRLFAFHAADWTPGKAVRCMHKEMMGALSGLPLET